MNSYYVYIIKSLKNDRYYVGISKNPEKRLKEHNKGDSKFTKGHRRWVIIYQEFVGERTKSREREKELKKSYTKRKNIIPG